MQTRTIFSLCASFLICFALVSGCETTPPETASDDTPAIGDGDIAQLAQMMTGTFSSAQQAATSPADFFNIRLVMAPIWLHRTDGVWFYVEQAVAAATDAPYRQRVYHVYRDIDDRIVSDVYTLPVAEAFVHGWLDRRLEGLAPADLTLRSGCTVVLERTGEETFAGGTEGEGCTSSLRGAAYATSEITIASGGMMAKDRGWAADGTQVWGPTAGAYQFRKLSPGVPADG